MMPNKSDESNASACINMCKNQEQIQVAYWFLCYSNYTITFFLFYIDCLDKKAEHDILKLNYNKTVKKCT